MRENAPFYKGADQISSPKNGDETRNNPDKLESNFF